MSESPNVRYVLVRAAEQGFFEAVAPALARFDPLLRGGIKKRARQAFAEASAATTVTDEGHVLRLAFLRAGLKPPPPANDVEGVKLAFETDKVMFPKRGLGFWPVSASILGVLVVVGIVLGFIFMFPTPRERFARSALGQAMGDGLTDWTVGISRHDFARQEKGREVLLTRGVKRQIGDSGYNLLGTALDQSKALAAAVTAEDVDREQTALSATLRALDTELQNKKLPAFFDNYVDTSFSGYASRSSTNVWLLAYYVDERATLTVGSETVPMLRGRRLDNLNLEVGGKGYESDILAGWVIAVDEVERWAVLNVAPALGKGHGFAFGSEQAKDEGSSGRLAAKAGERIRGDLLARAALSDEDGTELADLLSQRHSAFIRLSVLGDELFEPRGLVAKPRLKQALSRRKDLEMDAREITRIEDRLSRFEKPFERIVNAQMALDEIRIAADSTCRKTKACAFTADPELAKAMGGDTLVGAKAAAVASHLTLVGRAETTYFALAESEMGPGGYATHYMIERELGMSPDWLAPYGVKDEAEHGQLGVALFDKPPAEIRKAAESAYAKVFGVPMPTIVRTTAAR